MSIGSAPAAAPPPATGGFAVPDLPTESTRVDASPSVKGAASKGGAGGLSDLVRLHLVYKISV